MKRSWFAAGIGLLSLGSPAMAAPSILFQFDPTEVGSIVGATYSAPADTVWVYGSSNANIHQYSRSGAFLGSVPRPGEAADDFDIIISPAAFTLNATNVPAGSLLAVNGETGTADVYALNPATGAVIATLNTQFGQSHVVGGAYHPARNSIFLVQDRQPSDPAQRSLIAEVNPVTGAVINSFGTSSVDYTINFGDLEVHPVNGNLLLVSSDESAIRELTPTGVFVADYALPAGVSSISGIGVDAGRGEVWVSGTGGTVWNIGEVPEPGAMLLGALALAALGRRSRSR